MANIWDPFLEDNPQMLWNAWINKPFLNQGFNQSNSFLDYWRKQFGNVYGRYEGDLASQAMAGQTPEGTFYDWLKRGWSQQRTPREARSGQLGFDAGREWTNLTPWARGQSNTPRAIWNL